MIALMLLLVVPFVGIVQGIGGEAYPPAFARIWIYRPFWYAQLLMVLAAAGLLGLHAGLPFAADRRSAGGRGDDGTDPAGGSCVGLRGERGFGSPAPGTLQGEGIRVTAPWPRGFPSASGLPEVTVVTLRRAEGMIRGVWSLSRAAITLSLES